MPQYFSLLLLCFSFISTTTAQRQATYPTVQEVLAAWAPSHPQLVNQLSSGRYFLVKAQSGSTPDRLEQQLQDAFYRQYADICYVYGRRYLVDWRTILAKAARETYWGSSKLSNSANNYFGIRQQNKEWICESFGHCDVLKYHDPDLASFSIFPDFETSLWMFIHTIYSPHFLERLPDHGDRVVSAIQFEKRNGVHYWENVPGAYFPALLLPGAVYADHEIIATWSGYDINNLCVNCDRNSDFKWNAKLHKVASRVGAVPFSTASTYGSGR